MSAGDGERRAFLVVLDSVGCGALPDAAEYGDAGADTLGHVAAAAGGLRLPTLGSLGLGCLHAVPGVPPAAEPRGLWGRMAEASRGKDTTTGHWEIAGLILEDPFATFPGGFPAEVVERFSARTGRGVIGNRPASGTAIIEELGPEHARTGDLIVYTSADSVFQIAAHEEVVPLEELYSACRIAREICDPLRVGRVIARPFVGAPGSFRRTGSRRDFSMAPSGRTMLDALCEAGVPVTGVGKIEDIFAGRGVPRSFHVDGNGEGMERTLRLAREAGPGLVFTNLVDFDMLYGHRNDAAGYAAALEAADPFVAALEAALRPGDLAILTADHGCDPTTQGTDHTREHVPLIAFGPGVGGGPLGTRRTFADVAETILDIFGLPPLGSGDSFASALRCEAAWP